MTKNFKIHSDAFKQKVTKIHDGPYGDEEDGLRMIYYEVYHVGNHNDEAILTIYMLGLYLPM